MKGTFDAMIKVLCLTCLKQYIVEVKYKAHENDLDKLDRKMKNFKKLFPIYQNFKQYGAIASFHINDDAKKEALKRGYFVLQRSGDLVHTESAEHLTVL